MLHTGTVIEGPSNVTYLPNVTPLPIELTCNVTGLPIWIVNGTAYLIINLGDGALPGHDRIGANILINNPVNNTEYICVSLLTNDGETSSDPAYVIIAGEYVHIKYICRASANIVHINLYYVIKDGQTANFDIAIYI